MTLYNIEILIALRFKSSYVFLKCPSDPYSEWPTHLRISDIPLKFGWVMIRAMKQIIDQNHQAWLLFMGSCDIFHDKLVLGLRNDISTLSL